MMILYPQTQQKVIMSAYVPTKKWDFRRTTNTICFNEHFLRKGNCVMTIDVKILNDGNFMLDYTNIYNGKTEQEINDSKLCHPLHEKAISEDDESMLEGVIVAANMITFNMIRCLMCDDTDKSMYYTGCRPFNHYCGEIMRALTEMEI